MTSDEYCGFGVLCNVSHDIVDHAKILKFKVVIV